MEPSRTKLHNMAYHVHMSAAEALPEPEKAPNMPVGQNSVVPAGWHPTPSQPVPVVRCVQIKKDGTRCRRWSLRGYTKCKSHSGPGALLPDGNVKKYAAAVIEAAKLRLIEESDDAISGLVSLTQPGTAEQIRLKAYTEILDRAGVRGGYEVDVAVEVTDDPSDELRKRLTSLREGALAKQRMIYEATADVVDGEVLEDSEQLPLFDMDEDS